LEVNVNKAYTVVKDVKKKKQKQTTQEREVKLFHCSNPSGNHKYVMSAKQG